MDQLTAATLVNPVSLGAKVSAAKSGQGQSGQGQSGQAGKSSQGGARSSSAKETGLTREKVERMRAESSASPHSAYRARTQSKFERQHTMAAFAGWAGALVVVSGLTAGALTFRNDLSAQFPALSTAYAAAGLSVNPFGVEFGALDARREFEGVVPVLSVAGEVVNLSSRTRALPKVRVILRDEVGTPVAAWDVPLDYDLIEPDARVPFAVQFERPPVEAYRVDVTFVANTDGPNPGAAPVGPETVPSTEDAGHGPADSAADVHDAPVSHEAGHETDHAEGTEPVKDESHGHD
jgi:hypothetical protein